MRRFFLFLLGLCWSLLAHHEVFASGGPQWGEPVYATVTHDGGFGANPTTLNIDPIPFSLAPPIQFHNTITGSGGNESIASAGIGYYYDSSHAVATFAPGTGLSQAAPAGGNTAASLKLDFFDGFSTTRGWTGIRGYYSLPLTGNVPQGSMVEILLDLNIMTRIVPGGTKVFSHQFLVDWTRTEAGPFSTTLSDSVPLPNIPSTSRDREASISVWGSLEFRAKNDGGPVSVDAPQGFLVSTVPEPSTVVGLLTMGLLGLGIAWRRRQKK